MRRPGQGFIRDGPVWFRNKVNFQSVDFYTVYLYAGVGADPGA